MTCGTPLTYASLTVAGTLPRAVVKSLRNGEGHIRCRLALEVIAGNLADGCFRGNAGGVGTRSEQSMRLVVFWPTTDNLAIAALKDSFILSCSFISPSHAQLVLGSRAREKSDWRRTPLMIGEGTKDSPFEATLTEICHCLLV